MQGREAAYLVWFIPKRTLVQIQPLQFSPAWPNGKATVSYAVNIGSIPIAGT